LPDSGENSSESKRGVDRDRFSAEPLHTRTTLAEPQKTILPAIHTTYNYNEVFLIA
jgi:hypothetical protein